MHNLSLIRVMISHEVLKWKLEMHMAVKNTQCHFILSPIIHAPYPYLFSVGEGEEANTPHAFHHYPEMTKAIKLKLYDFKDTS